jgi:hypothetical protein
MPAKKLRGLRSVEGQVVCLGSAYGGSRKGVAADRRLHTLEPEGLEGRRGSSGM